MSFIINGSDSVFLKFEKLANTVQVSSVTWLPDSKDEKAATLKDITKRFLKLYPLQRLDSHLLAKIIIKSILPQDRLEVETRKFEAFFEGFDDLIFSLEKNQLRIDTNLKRLVWSSLAISKIIPEFESQDQLNDISIFFHHLLSSERYYEGNDYSLQSAEQVKVLYQKNLNLLDKITFYPPDSHLPLSTLSSPLQKLSVREMSTKYLGDMILTPASAKGYQDPQFRPEKEATIFLLEMPKEETESLVWLGNSQEIPETNKTYYVHPEAAEIHARNGINLSKFKKTEVLKTSSPRSFLHPSISENTTVGIKLSLPRWFAGAIRLVSREQIEISVMVDQFLKTLPDIKKTNRIEVWSDFAGCLPSERTPFGMLFRKVNLVEGFDIHPFFSLGNLSLTFAEKMDQLRSTFEKILFYAFEYGVIFESHAQNLLMGHNHQTIYRDNGGVFISPDLLKNRYGLDKAESMIAWTSSMPTILFDRLWRLFCGSCVYSTFCHDQMPREDVEKIYEDFFSIVKDDMMRYSPNIRSAKNMKETCLILDKEFRLKYCKLSPIHRITK